MSGSQRCAEASRKTKRHSRRSATMTPSSSSTSPACEVRLHLLFFSLHHFTCKSRLIPFAWPGFSPSLKELIEDPKRIKLGVQVAGWSRLSPSQVNLLKKSGWSGDGRKLKSDFGHKPAGLLELNNVARLVDGARWENRTTYGLIGLQALTAIYLDKYLAKDASVRCGAWAGPLSTEQRFCASFASL